MAFWVGGHLYRTERDRLYDLRHQSDVRAELLGAAEEVLDGELPFVYPPVVAAVLAPLSRLPFQTAFLTFAIVALVTSLASLGYLAVSLGLGSPRQLGAVILFSLGFVPFGLNTILGGQFPWLGIVVLSLVSAFTLTGRDFAAGLAMSLSYYKPPLFLLLLLTLALARGRRFILGFATGAAVLMGLTIMAVGLDGLEAYLSVVSRYTYGQDLTEQMALPSWAGMGLVGFLATVLGSMKWTLGLLFVPFVAVGWIAARGLGDGDRLVSMTLIAVATLAFSLQFNKYDLALLLVPGVLLFAWQVRHGHPPGPWIWASFGAFYFEFALRGVEVAGITANVSWLFLLSLLGGLVRAALRPATPTPAPSRPGTL